MSANQERRRGALVVLEGGDRAGKTTQAALLVTGLWAAGVQAQGMRFPNRLGPDGPLIDDFLAGKVDMEWQASHLIFAANRWLDAPKIIRLLGSGVTVVLDRYHLSGLAYSRAKAREVGARDGQAVEDWCFNAERGLPKPDLVFLLEVDPETAARRDQYGAERYDRVDFQTAVVSNLGRLVDALPPGQGMRVSGQGGTQTEVARRLLAPALAKVAEVQGTALDFV